MSDLRQRLKHETAEAHEQLERSLVIGSDACSFDDYRGFLERMFCFHEPLERALARVIAGNEWESEFRTRTKLPALRDDLCFLGHDERSLAMIPRCDELPDVEDMDHFWGIEYVLEGSTLGGTLLARLVQKRWGFSVSKGASYFNVYGDRTGKMWAQFCNQLGACDLDASATRIVEAANRTFATLKNWLEAGPAQRDTRKSQSQSMRLC